MPLHSVMDICSRHPTLKWAQRDDLLYITIDLPDAKAVNLKLEPEGKFYFSATSGADNIPYEIDINLYDNVNVDVSTLTKIQLFSVVLGHHLSLMCYTNFSSKRLECPCKKCSCIVGRYFIFLYNIGSWELQESKASVGSRNIVYIVKKEESKWWSRLLKQEGRTPTFIKVDWNKWVDEDEQDDKGG